MFQNTYKQVNTVGWDCPYSVFDESVRQTNAYENGASEKLIAEGIQVMCHSQTDKYDMTCIIA